MMKFITDAEAGYSAGVVDGEGTLSMTKREYSANWSPNYAVIVEVTNTKREMCDWLKETTGIGTVSPKTHTNKRHKRTYVWKLDRHEMAAFLNRILPFLVIKEDQARLLLEMLNLENPNSPCDRVDPKVNITREFIWRELSALNKRGV